VSAASSPRLLSSNDPLDILEAVRILRDGGVVAVPTDTLYGLAASTFHPTAIDRVFELKERPAETRVPLLIGTAADLVYLTSEVPRVAWKLIDQFWPGGITIIFDARRAVPREVTRGGGTVAIRVPASSTCLQLLQSLGEPVTGTSANLSGQPAALRASEVLAAIPGCDAILEDDSAIGTGLPSTIVDVTGNVPIITRVGAVSIGAVREVAGTQVRVLRK
jgi:L-threonylcarbamoyladenylate synthase